MNDLKIRTGKRFLALILAFVMILGVIPTTAFAVKANSVVIAVKDSAGKPVDDAKVTVTFAVKEGEALTAESEDLEKGRVEFVYEGDPNDVTSVSYKVEKKDHVTVTGTTTLGSKDVEISLIKSEITMNVVDAEKKPIASAVATYKVNGEGEEKNGESKEAGKIVVDLADTDSKIVGSISAVGYASVKIDIENGASKEIVMPKAQVVFNVKDAQDAAVAGAAVKVTIGDSADAVINTVTDEKGSAVVDLSGHAVTAETVISYTIDKDGTNAAKDGFKTVTGTTVAGETVDVKLEKVTHLAEIAVVDADGNALDGVEVTMTVDGKATAKATTKNGVASHTFEVENPENLSYSATVCEVAYSGNAVCGTGKTEAVLTANQAVTLKVAITGSGNGTVTVGGTQMANGSSLLVKKDTPITIAVAPGEKCRVAAQDIPGTNNGDGTYTFAQGGTITVEFVQTYTVTVTYDAAQGTAQILDGDTAAGTVTVDKGKEGLKLHVVADESKGYEIASVTGFNSVEGQTDVTLDIPKVNEDKNIEVVFQLKTYKVELQNNSDRGEASVSGDRVQHGGSVTLTVIPAKSYVIDSVVVSGQISGTEKVYTAVDFSENQITFDEVTEPINIVVTYAGIDDALIEQFSITAVDEKGNDITETKLIRYDKNSKLYVFSKDTKVKIYSDFYNVLRLERAQTYGYGNYKNTYYQYEAGGAKAKLQDSLYVDYVQWHALYVIDDDYAENHEDADLKAYSAWSEVTYTNEKGHENTAQIWGEGWKTYYTPSADQLSTGSNVRLLGMKWDGSKWQSSEFNNLRIVFDSMGPDVALATENGIVGDKDYKDSTYYTGDVTINVTATEEEYYSGMASIEYYISDKNSTENAEWTVADMSGAGEKVGTASFTVTAADHDWENVYVFVRATDKAGNVTTELVETLHINTKAPTVNVDVACEADHDTYCNCDKRTMTVTVTDRPDTIADNIEIFWGANDDHEETLNIEWSDELDEAGNKVGVATYSFTEEACYSYWALTYQGQSHMVDKISGDVFYIDRTLVSEVLITPGVDEEGNAPLNGIYSNSIVVTVNAEEPDMKTGIKEVKFEVGYYEGENFKVTESFAENDRLNEDGTFTGTFHVDPSLNNRCDVVLRVTTLDNAGNEYQQESRIDIDITAPKVEISFDNNTAANEKYYNADRTATIVVTDRAGHFDPATGSELTITAKGAEGNVLENPALGEWVWDEEAAHGEEITYTAKVAFTADANYTFDFAATDLAGNKSGVVSNEFTVDKNVPTGKLHADAVIVSLNENDEKVATTIPSDWDNMLVTPLTFGIWSNDTITVTGIADDATSDIAKVEFYEHNGDVALTYDEDEKVLKNGDQVITAWSDVGELKGVEKKAENETDPATHHKGYDVGAYTGNQQFTIYLRITDLAGNVSYISTNGMIVDNKEPTGEQPGTGTQTVGEVKIDIPEGNKNGFHTGDIDIGISVIDPMFSGNEANSERGTFAGLKSVSYTLIASDTGTTTGETVLFDENSTNGATYSGTGLCSSWTGKVTVPAADFNSNHVILLIKAVDNADNVQYTTTTDGQIKIDTAVPKIHIAYDNNTPDSGSFYKSDRSATITITERNFDAAAVTAYITKNNEAFAMLDPAKWEFKKGADGGNGDDTQYSQTIRFNTDGDYTFHLECTDLADWTCGNVEGKSYDNEVTFAGGTQNPTAFTIDKTLPTISVSYNNNAAQNGKYFNATRTATITIVEHNFDLNRVHIEIATARGGSAPRISWRDNDDTHVATVAYTADGDYTFDINMTDKAGNANSGVSYGNSVAAKDFVVDTTYSEMVAIADVENGAAYGYGQSVIPGVAISDINLDVHELTLVGVQKDKTIDLTEEAMKLLSGSATDIHGYLDLFKMIQELDGIYTLTVTGKDKAGNVDTEEVTFTINRFGSVYAYGEYLSDLIADGGSYVYSVDEDLIITEYNADRLLANSLIVEITRDGKPLENVIYEVTPEINELAKPGTSGWYQYNYTISAENFAADGVYKIAVSSKDATGNTPENLNYEDMGITFRVDSTQAEITSVVGLEEPIFNASEIEVKYTIFDTIGLKSIKIYVDGELVDEVTDFTGDMNNYTGSFFLTESKNAQSVRLVVEDMSGNITDTDAEDFSSAYVFNRSVTVSTKFFVRWYANKALFWGSIVGTVTLAGLLWFFLVGKRKKDEETKN